MKRHAADSTRSHLDELITDPVVQLTLRADGVAESEFREILRAAGWKIARHRAGREEKSNAAPVPTTAGAEYRLGVGIMLLDRRNSILVGQRIDSAAEAWQMPQGGIELDEEPLHAALRELKEEIGTANVELVAESAEWHRYELPPDLLGKAWHGRWRGQLQKWFVMRFLGSDDEIDVHTTVPEFSAWKWVPPEDITNLVVTFKRQLYVDLLAEFGESHLRSKP